MACLDTTFLIDLAGGGGKARCARAASKLRGLVGRGELLVTTRFNVAELYVGVHRSSDPDAEMRAVRALLAAIGILDFQDREAKLFGHVTAHLQRLGRPVGDMDVLIAVTALSAGHVLVSDNVAHFAGIPDLVIETY
ncbi:MAG: hypothetical protein A3K18_11820 [Lentisphaerae bacterium RIFOXYA12_64_32]|nr:MAG: hypothetical protein A3K18_11820 [Lentisphaerae bacterium RIFOXYA12_64_32]